MEDAALARALRAQGKYIQNKEQNNMNREIAEALRRVARANKSSSENPNDNGK